MLVLHRFLSTQTLGFVVLQRIHLLHIYPKCVYIYSSAFPETEARFRFVWWKFGHTASDGIFLKIL
jgi:hypothetical protein